MEGLESLIKQLVEPKKGIILFVNKFLSHLTPCAIPTFHEEIYEFLTTKLRLALAAPRSFAKSTVVSIFYPVYLTTFSLRKNIIIISASQTLAINWLKRIKKEFETNEVLRALYFNIYGKMPEGTTWKENEIILSNEVRIQAIGAGGQTRGPRPDCVICDDLETTEGVRSPEQRKNLDEWFRKDILGLLEPTGQLVVIGTILHYDSLLKNLVDTANSYGWSTKLFQAYIDGIQKEGHELWREKWSHEELQKKKAEQGTAFFASEYMNDPISEETAIFKRENIRVYTELPEKYSCVMQFDPAYSEESHSDFKTCVIVAIDDKNNRYLVEYVRTKQPLNDYIQASISLFIKYKRYITCVGCPSGREVEFFNKVLEFANARGIFMPIKETKNIHTQSTVTVRNKKDRITMALQGLFQQGKYYLKPEHEEARDELLRHPLGKHDDLVDAMASCEQIIVPTYFAFEEKDPDYVEEEPVARGMTGYGDY
jgi:phage terminase large subunit-like protein